MQGGQVGEEGRGKEEDRFRWEIVLSQDRDFSSEKLVFLR
jgi:hypothetical protein